MMESPTAHEHTTTATIPLKSDDPEAAAADGIVASPSASSPESASSPDSDESNQPPEHIDILVHESDLQDIHKVVIRELGPTKKKVKLFYADDVLAFDEISAWQNQNPEKSISDALAYFCPKRRSADVLVRLIYGDTEEPDYVLTYKTHHNHHRSEQEENFSYIRSLFEEKLLHHGVILEIEKSLDTNHMHFVKVFTPFHFLALEAYKLGLQFNLREPLHTLDSDAHPPEKRNGIFQYFKTYHLDLNKHTADLDPLDLSSFEFKLPDPTTEEKHRIVSVINQPCHIVLTKFFERRHRILLAHHAIISAEMRVLTRTGLRTEGINYLLSHRIYLDFFPTHDEDIDSPVTKGKIKLTKREDLACENVSSLRTRLIRQWVYGPMFRLEKPVDLIREYFGEEVAFYFVYLEFYNRCLGYSALCGLIVFLYGIYEYLDYQSTMSKSHLYTRGAPTHDPISNLTDSHSNTTTSPINSGGGHGPKDDSWHKLFDNALTPWFALFMSLWSVCYTIAWSRREKYYAFKWSMHNYNPPPLRRVEFHAVGVKKSPVTNKKEQYFPEESRSIRQIISFLVLLVFCAISCASVLVQIFFIIHYEEEGVPEMLVAFGAAMMGVILIQICRRVFHPVCHFLNHWENYRTEEEFEQALVLKQWSFEFINIYCHIVYFAFIRPHLNNVTIFGQTIHASATCNSDKDVCSADVILELLVIFICDQAIERFEEIGVPRIKALFRSKIAKANKRGAGGSKYDLHSKIESGLPSIHQDNEYSADELRPQYYRDQIRDAYEGLYEDYFPKAIQYGYVTMFVTAFPLAPFFALLNNGFETRMDLFKLLKVLRRAPPFLGSGIGIWGPILRGCSVLAVSTNGLLVTFSSEYFFTHLIETYDESQWMVVRLTFLITWHVVIYTSGIVLLWMIPDEPAIIKIARDREAYLEKIILDPTAEAEDEEFGNNEAEADHK
ncbi:calcium-activated chloride channel-domain-containing protein [Obelidium mucronatum]|nr:calcium-activated chloride channel-domain-containing protein [Obelidium mucronatum]